MIGQSIDRYHILEQLGEGGMATVYKAFDMRLERDVAIKFLRTERLNSRKSTKRFENEAKALAKLNHPNIVQVLDYGKHNETPYLVMEYVTGGTLKVNLGKPMPWQEAAKLLAPISHALTYAHENNIVHRDVKPSNILVANNGEVKLSDFGIAKILGLDETYDLTGTQVGIGTPWYMAPEQCTGDHIDNRADIYSLGVVYYEFITGRKPYNADTPMAVAWKHLNAPLPRPRKFVPTLPTQIEEVLIKALAKDPNHRFQKMDEFAEVLEKLVQGKRVIVELPKKIFRMAVAIISIVVLGLIGIGIRSFVSEFSVQIASRVTSTISPSTTVKLMSEAVQNVDLTKASTSTLIPRMTNTSIITPTSSSTPIPTIGLGSTQISPVDGMVQIYIPEGEFLMGITEDDLERLVQICQECDPYNLSDARPQSIIYLDGFWIDQTEVTNSQFEQFIIETGYLTSAERTQEYSYVINPSLNNFQHDPIVDWRHPHGIDSNIIGHDGYPVTQISWDDANAYCRWAERRLPTEAEWEKAARGTDGRIFPWGDDSPNTQLLNFNYILGGPTQVGSFPNGISPYGTLDMAGNVREWVADFYQEDYYQVMPESNPIGPSTGDGHTMRGASWATTEGSELFFVTSVLRLWNYPNISSDVLGFRCATDSYSYQQPNREQLLEVVSQITPTDFVQEYYETVNHKLYQKAWDMLSQHFIDTHNRTGYIPYMEWWSKVDHVNIISTQLISDDGNIAIVRIHIAYYFVDGGQDTNDILDVTLAPIIEQGSWVIYDTQFVSAP